MSEDGSADQSESQVPSQEYLRSSLLANTISDSDLLPPSSSFSSPPAPPPSLSSSSLPSSSTFSSPYANYLHSYPPLLIYSLIFTPSAASRRDQLMPHFIESMLRRPVGELEALLLGPEGAVPHYSFSLSPDSDVTLH